MPFIITEPQKIEGTKLGFSVYPYHFSFNDKNRDRSSNQKLVIFKLKDSQFIEPDFKVFELKYADHIAARNFVDKNLKEFVVAHPEFVTEPQKVVEYFNGGLSFEKDKEEVKIL